MEKHLKVKLVLSFILHHKFSLQRLWSQNNAINQSKLMGPRLLELFRNILWGKTEINLNGGGFFRVFAEKIPFRYPGETVLGEVEGGRVGAEGWEDEWDTAADGLGSIYIESVFFDLWMQKKTPRILGNDNLPSLAPSLTNNFSSPPAFQLVTVAP